MLLLTVFLLLLFPIVTPSATHLVGLSFSALEQTATDVCLGQRCDTAACPCGCECGTANDSGLCFVPKETVKYSSNNNSSNSNNNKNNSNNSRVATQDTKPVRPNGVVSVNIHTGQFQLLHALPSDVLIVESAWDSAHQIFYMLNGATLLAWDQRSQAMLPDVELDVTRCDGGSVCFNELRFDSKNNRLLSVAVGFGGPQLAIVALNVTTGTALAVSPPVSRECALYLECSSFDPIKQIFYPWLACEDTPTASLYAIHLTGNYNKTILKDWEFHSILGPSIFEQGVGVVAINPENELVKVNQDNTTTHLSKTIGSIPSNNGLAGTITSAYVSSVDYSKNVLTSINLSTGEIMASIDIPYLFESVHVIDIDT
jgi:hypothetical protein